MSVTAAILLLGSTLPTADSRAAASVYGEITLRNGTTMNGALRWGEQESLWFHHFNGDRATPFDLESLPEEINSTLSDKLPGRQFQLGGHTVELRKFMGRQPLTPQPFAVEFGAIDRLEVNGQRVTIVLRDGATIDADGGSNDIGADIEVMDSNGGTTEIDWDDIEQVQFRQAPAEHPLFLPPLYAHVRTINDQRLSGTILWDVDEAYPNEILDAEEDGREIEIPFSEITALARDGDSTRVTTRNGQTQLLTGTNDVNNGNRGLMVTSEQGEIVMAWRLFDSLSLVELPIAQLPDRSAWANIGLLRGEVVDSDGNRQSGKLVLDLHQHHQAEHIEGDSNDMEWAIGLRHVASISPDAEAPHRLLVTTVDGKRVQMASTQQLPRHSLGWLVGDAPRLLPWEDFTQATLQTPPSSASPTGIETSVAAP